MRSLTTDTSSVGSAVTSKDQWIDAKTTNDPARAGTGGGLCLQIAQILDSRDESEREPYSLASEIAFRKMRDSDSTEYGFWISSKPRWAFSASTLLYPLVSTTGRPG